MVFTNIFPLPAVLPDTANYLRCVMTNAKLACRKCTKVGARNSLEYKSLNFSTHNGPIRVVYRRQRVTFGLIINDDVLMTKLVLRAHVQ